MLARRPGLAPRRQLLIAQGDRKRSGLGVDADHVAILEKTDRSADRRLRADMPDAEAARGARKPAIGDEGDLVPHALAVKRGRRGQHFAHAGPTARPFIADDQNVAFLVVLVLDGVEDLFLTVKTARGPGELEPV